MIKRNEITGAALTAASFSSKPFIRWQFILNE